MGIIKPTHKAHPFLAIMFVTTEHLERILMILQNRLGAYYPPGPVYPVNSFTDYYLPEFGPQLQKQFYLFKTPTSLENFHQIKVWTNQLETDHTIAGTTGPKRWINLDPGYLEPSKLVLFSTKNYAHRIYIGSGIYAETTLIYEHGDFKQLPWTYPDYYYKPNRRYLLELRATIVQAQRHKLS